VREEKWFMRFVPVRAAKVNGGGLAGGAKNAPEALIWRDFD
jgi:hypothetical protein